MRRSESCACFHPRPQEAEPGVGPAQPAPWERSVLSVLALSSTSLLQGTSVALLICWFFISSEKCPWGGPRDTPWVAWVPEEALS